MIEWMVDMNILNDEQKQQFNEILNRLGETLDITEEEHNAAVKSYEFVGNWLSADDSPLALYKPEILPQGSFMLGTMVRPINEDDDLDIDLVCRLEGKQSEWTQAHIKKIVGERLASNGTLKKMLKIPDGRRCWTLQYADSAKFHMDVLPSITSSGYRILMERMFSSVDKDVESLAIRITDNQEGNYKYETSPERWPKSNPFGYGIWFENRARIAGKEIKLMTEAIQPVPRYESNKLPLQRIVQILKRHRDMMFNGDEDKPISIIITTLAAKSYQQERDVYGGLLNIISKIPDFIEERYSDKHGRFIKWIPNPVNSEENFADKWAEKQEKQDNFYAWLTKVKDDINTAIRQPNFQSIMESMKNPFGEKAINKAVGLYGEDLLEKRKNGSIKMAATTGTIGAEGRTIIQNHEPYGRNK